MNTVILSIIPGHGDKNGKIPGKKPIEIPTLLDGKMHQFPFALSRDPRQRAGHEPTIREKVASGPDAEASRDGTPGSLQCGGRSRRDPTQKRGEGPKPTIREKVASGPNTEAERIETPERIREQVASGPNKGAHHVGKNIVVGPFWQGKKYCGRLRFGGNRKYTKF
jgi:hypothetical protein